MGKTLSMSRDVEEALAHAQVMDQVMANLQKKGVVLPNAPKWGGELYDGQLPPNISSMADRDVGELLTITNQWKNFLRGQLAFYEGCRDEAKKQARVQLAYLRKQHSDTAKTTEKKWMLDDVLERDARVQDITREHLYFSNLVRILNAAYDAAESDFNTVSRTITLRGQARSGAHREHSQSHRRASL
tara:strand:+ start:535 stop:1095 length:561 start_codon:yes stop_codon:yes gene_type:complete